MRNQINDVHEKSPDETDLYQFNWEPRLNGATISTSTMILDSGITNEADSKTNTATEVAISGGTDKSNYYVINRVTTSDSRTLEGVKVIKVRAVQQAS